MVGSILGSPHLNRFYHLQVVAEASVAGATARLNKARISGFRVSGLGFKV